MPFETSLRDHARNLPDEPLPGVIKARIMSDNRFAASVSNAPKTRQFPWWRKAAAVCFLVLCVGAGAQLGRLSAVNRHGREGLRFEGVGAPVLAGEVADAISRSNTWHLSGWRIEQGRVNWEIWGRRVPFFFREQIGDRIVLDDGRRRIVVIPPDPVMKRKTGVEFMLPSRSVYSAMDPFDRANSYLADPDRGGKYFSSVAKQGAHSVLASTVISNRTIRKDEQLTIDNATKLPVSDVVAVTQVGDFNIHESRASQSQPVAMAELDAAYNVVLPDKLDSVMPPAGYVVIDTLMRRGAAKGLALHGSALGRDPAGNLHLLVQGQICGVPITKLPGYSLALGSPYGTHGRDNLGNRYTSIINPDPLAFGGNPMFTLWMVPDARLPVGAHPTTLKMTIPVYFSCYERGVELPMPGSTTIIKEIDAGTDYLASGSYTVTISLPKRARPLQYNPQGVVAITHIGKAVVASYTVGANKTLAEIAEEIQRPASPAKPPAARSTPR